MKKNFRRISLFGLFLSAGIFWTGCLPSPYRSYIPPEMSPKRARQLKKLFSLLEKESPRGKSLPIRRILSFYQDSSFSDDRTKAYSILFLKHFLMRNKNSPDRAYYLSRLANYYLEGSEPNLARYYLIPLLRDKEVRRFPSLRIQALKNLRKTGTPFQKIDYLKELIRLEPETKRAPYYYDLGKAYESTASWKPAYTAYDDFLASYHALSGAERNSVSSRAYEEVRTKLVIHKAKRNWTKRDLTALTGIIRRAIRRRDIRTLRYYKSDYFFSIPWAKSEDSSFSHIPFRLSSFLHSGIRVHPRAENFSNEEEVYLKTSGWSYRIPVWYFYFRRVDYPEDPELHNSWEWGGIYLGEYY